MSIRSYSLAKDGKKKLSANFTVAEFACKDGSDIIKIDDKLIAILQHIRNHFGVAIIINSAYRTPAHNAACGGSPQSQHLYGMAADIVARGISPLAVAQYGEALGVGGIGHYPAGQGSFTHLDTRAGSSRWEQRQGKAVALSGFGGQSFAQQVQKKAGLDDNTMVYLQQYKYAAALLEKLAAAMG